MLRLLYKLYSKVPMKARLQVVRFLQRANIWHIVEKVYFEQFLNPKKDPKNGDLNWKQFQEEILAFRDSYKLVFVQERVIPWHSALFQRPQQISIALGKLNCLVIYQTHPFGVDSHIKGFRQISANVWLSPYSLTSHIEGAFVSTYSGNPSRPEVAKRGNRKLIYEYVDHIDPQIVGLDAMPKLNLKLQAALSGDYDLNIASSLVLREQFVDKDQPCTLVPNGVDDKLFRLAQDNPIEIDHLARFRARFKLTVGYVGALAPWLDFDFVNRITELNPDVGFIFIGPDYGGGKSKLAERANSLVLPAIAHELVPHHMKYFDIGWIPFALGDLAKSTNPLKLFEYFAAGLPVIVTPDLVECRAFAGFVASTHSDPEFKSACRELVSKKTDPSWNVRIQELVEANSWEARAKDYFEAMNAID